MSLMRLLSCCWSRRSWSFSRRWASRAVSASFWELFNCFRKSSTRPSSDWNGRCVEYRQLFKLVTDVFIGLLFWPLHLKLIWIKSTQYPLWQLIFLVLASSLYKLPENYNLFDVWCLILMMQTECWYHVTTMFNGIKAKLWLLSWFLPKNQTKKVILFNHLKMYAFSCKIK